MVNKKEELIKALKTKEKTDRFKISEDRWCAVNFAHTLRLLNISYKDFVEYLYFRSELNAYWIQQRTNNDVN